MKLREQIENNLVVWLFGTLFTGFMAGIGTYKAILDIAQLEVVSRAKLEALQRGQSSTVEGLNSNPSLRENGSSTNVALSQASGFALSANPPFPRGLDSVRPGMTLSTARSVFPDGELRSGAYMANLDSDVFRAIAFLVYPRGQDPRIHTINIFLSDDYPMSDILAILLGELDEWPHRTEMLGERVVWENIKGYQLEVEDGAYTISVPVENDRQE